MILTSIYRFFERATICYNNCSFSFTRLCILFCKMHCWLIEQRGSCKDNFTAGGITGWSEGLRYVEKSLLT